MNSEGADVTEVAVSPEMQGALFDYGPGRDMLLFIFGGVNIDEIYDLTQAQLIAAADVLAATHAAIHRPPSEAERKHQEAEVMYRRMNGESYETISQVLGITVQVAKNRTFAMADVLQKKLDDHSLAELLAQIRELPPTADAPASNITEQTADTLGSLATSDAFEAAADASQESEQSEMADATSTPTSARRSVPAPTARSKKVKLASPGRGRYVEPREKRVDPEEDLVRLYLQEIGRHELLDKEGEARLSKRVQAGLAAKAALAAADETLDEAQRRALLRTVRDGDDATKDFVNRNLRLVVSIAKRYQSSGLPLLDLVQEGNFGLMHAVEKFDWQKGFKFSTYATWWIRQAIQRGIANTGRSIRLPVHAGDELKAVLKARDQMARANGGVEPTLAELAEATDMPESRVAEVLQYTIETVSLDNPVNEDGDAALKDFVGDRNAVDPADAAVIATLPESINQALAVLDERERRIMVLRFGLDGGESRTLKEVGAIFNLTRERVRQIEARSMSKLRHPSADKGLRELLS